MGPEIVVFGEDPVLLEIHRILRQIGFDTESVGGGSAKLMSGQTKGSGAARGAVSSCARMDVL